MGLYSLASCECHRLSHVDGVLRFFETDKGNEVFLHFRVLVGVPWQIYSQQFLEISAAFAVDNVLVFPLKFLGWVSENSSHIVWLGCHTLRMGKTVVKHVLIVLDETCVMAELVAESVLWVWEDIFLFSNWSHVGATAVWLTCKVVLTEVRVERPLSVSRSVFSA